MNKKWDVIVIGAGHAGCEAALAAARMKQQTLLLTMTVDNIAQMSCNPAIGGVAKGHIVKEIDALGGIMGYIADETGIQFRTLNTRKGAAVQATRCQSDMIAYKIKMKNILEAEENLTIQQAEVNELLWEENRVIGARTSLGEEIHCGAVVITTGTFLNGLIHIGDQRFEAGRAWEFPSKTLSEHIQDRGVLMGRLKTGTTPRLNRHTINFDVLEEQPGEVPIPKFSFWPSETPLRQVPCHITYTNPRSHEIIRENLDRSAMYSGQIESVGPRYCPSIEDKVVKFPDKDRHQIFLEPTSLDSVEYYPNGMSTSMPLDVQVKFMRSIEGLENVEIIRPGYAIEYDFAYPHQLKSSLELKDFENLFLGGQINGTTGYEEAAAQGLMAGINAALKIQGKESFILKRHESYIGVLIDDLISKGTTEPYRMFTSRAEYRLMLREDNADQRLSQKGYDIGLLTAEKYQMFQEKNERIGELGKYLKENYVYPSEDLNRALEDGDVKPLKHRLTLENFLKGANSSLGILEKLDLEGLDVEELKNWNSIVKKFVETEIRYAGYVKRQESQLKQYLKIEAVQIPNEIDYDVIGGLSNEVLEKLKHHRPQTLGQASKISGVTPAAVSIIMVYLRNQAKLRKKAG